jgi:hypothetical protein
VLLSRKAWKACSTLPPFIAALMAALPRYYARPARPRKNVLRKINIEVKGVGQECPTHTSNPGSKKGAMFEKWREAWWVMMGRK